MSRTGGARCWSILGMLPAWATGSRAAAGDEASPAGEQCCACSRDRRHVHHVQAGGDVVVPALGAQVAGQVQTRRRRAAPAPAARPWRGSRSPSGAPPPPSPSTKARTELPSLPTRSARTTRARVQHEDRLLVARRRRGPAARSAAPVATVAPARRACPPPRGRRHRAARRQRRAARPGRHGTRPRAPPRQREAGRHRMPAAGHQQAGLARGDHRGAEIHARRPTGRSPWPARPPAPATQAGRLNFSLMRPATMPTTPGCQPSPRHQQHGMAATGLRSRRGLEGGRQHVGLDLLPPPVHRIQRARPWRAPRPGRRSAAGAGRDRPRRCARRR